MEDEHREHGQTLASSATHSNAQQQPHTFIFSSSPTDVESSRVEQEPLSFINRISSPLVSIWCLRADTMLAAVATALALVLNLSISCCADSLEGCCVYRGERASLACARLWR